MPNIKYANIKIRAEKIEKIKNRLNSLGLEPKSDANAVEIILDNFMLNKKAEVLN